MKIDYELAQDLYTGLNTSVDQLVDYVKEIKKIITKLDNSDSWDGNGFNTYKSKLSKLVDNFGSCCNYLYTLNNNIMSAIDRYQQVDAQVAQVLSGSGGS